MKKIIVFLLILMLRFPMSEWERLTDKDKEGMAIAISRYFIEKFEPTCVDVRINFLDGKDQFVYVDAICKKKKGVEI